ncbi:zinc finger protein 618 isoform X2 [Ranitomeya imitator]|uniref:zinc finger protein 618 isoform X2 n=1 Tax=Ranitomeya imitator TaxID=111125 RepID=UPI0037E94A5B
MSTKDVTVKTEKPEYVLQPALWNQEAKNAAEKRTDGGAKKVPAEICVVIGENHNQQNIEKPEDVHPGPWKSKAKNAAEKKMEGGTEKKPAEVCVVIGENHTQQKNEKTEDLLQPALWKKTAKNAAEKKMEDGAEKVPAEICVVIGENHNQQNIVADSPERHTVVVSREASWSGGSRPRSIPPRISTSSPGSYECGICRKKYKYYNCFQTHVRAHIDNEVASVEGVVQGNLYSQRRRPYLRNREVQEQKKIIDGFGGTAAFTPDNFRYTCDVCGKKYKYYSCFQEHRDLHAVDDTYIHMMVTSGDAKEEDLESCVRFGPKTGNYMCEFCGKQYKYYTPYQEHVALHTPIKSAFSQDVEEKQHNNYEENNSNSQHSSAGSCRTHTGMSDMVGGSGGGGNMTNWQKEATSPMTSSSFPLMQGKGWKKRIKRKVETNNKSVKTEKSSKVEEPYTCGACGIQFLFYSNLLEHMQSHAADNENTITTNQTRSLPPAEESWKSQPQRNNTNNTAASSAPVPAVNNSLPETERQHIAERLLRVMCADLGALSVVNGKDFLRLAQTLVDTGARYGSFAVNEILGNMNTLALKHLPRMYNQVKVKVTCALGSNICLGIGVTCHSQSVGQDSCYILTAYQAEGNQIKRYVLGIKDLDSRESGEFIHQWVQNILSEFVMSEIRTVYVTDCKVNTSAFSKVGTCLRCSACSLNCVVQSVLNKRTLQARNMHEVIELLNVTEELAGSTGIARETFGSLEESCPPPCWNSVTDSLLLVHERYEQICEFYSRAKKLNIIQNLNKHLLSNLAAILAPVKQAVIELSNERRPTLQLVLPTYVRLEKLFTSKANDAGVISKLCHLFLEALKENFKVESAHKVAMILDPQQKLRPVPPYQHEEIISKVCELIYEVEETELEAPAKKPRQSTETTKVQEDDRLGKNEVYDYLQEPVFKVTPHLFQYWSSVSQKHKHLSKLAFWLLAVPAVGARSECVNTCEQTLLIKKKRLLSPEDMNKVMFLKSNML